MQQLVQETLQKGAQLHQQGLLVEAETLYRKILETAPGHPDANHLLGLIERQAGRNEQAVEWFSRAIQANPDVAAYHGNLGNAFRDLGRLEDAVASYRKALTIQPDFAEAHSNLGSTLKELGRLDEAVASYRKALAIKPDYPVAHSNLGNVLKELGRLDEAVASFKKALEINPDFAEAHNNLGNALQDLGALEDAVASYRKALAIQPDYAEAHSNLGNALQDLGALDEAVASYHKALAAKPDFTEAHSNLGNALQNLERLDEAVASYHKALAIQPDYAEAHYNLGGALLVQGNVDGAAKQIDLALFSKPEKSGWRVKKTLLLPIIPHSEKDINARRKILAEDIMAISNQGLNVLNPLDDVGTTNFHLAYHGQDNRKLVEDIARMHIAACPTLTYEAKHCRSGEKDKRDILRIGFVSLFLCGHTIGKLNRGIIENLSRTLFEVIVFRPPGKRDQLSNTIDDAADKVVPLVRRLETDRKIIEKEELDILFYPEIGMDPYTYYLAFARLAPVQVVTWGHPDTTGIPNIDYFMSWKPAEPRGASKYYSEQLIQLRYLTSYYYRPKIPNIAFTHDDYGLPKNATLYVCPQTLFKFHPSFDAVLGNLLRRDSDGRLVLIDDGKGGKLRKLLVERFDREFPEVADRVIFIPKMPYENFLGLLTLADAILDIPTFSGGNSSLEAFGMGAPIVTWPGKFLRGRLTAACYEQMGLSDLIATDAESYLKLALRLAQDADFKRRMQTDIKANAHKLYESHETVREMECFFIAAYEAWKTGETLTNSSIGKWQKFATEGTSSA